MPSNDDPTIPGTTPPELHGLDAGELLARGLHTVKPSIPAGPWEPPTPEELAALLPQYQIESLLGHGGMGAVYKGTQAALDRPVAIKLLPAELAADADFIARFQREARTLAKLQHSSIVAVHDFGQTSAGHLYFVMEYVDGTDLQRILKGPGLKPEQAFVLIGQICEALHYAHQQGVIHRDIKPANILITKDGRAKVADFGLARPAQDETGGLTQTNMIMGTPDYMAPEQRTGDGHPDHRADIFALGVMLYEMLTGQRPQGAFQPPSHRVQVDVRIDEVVLKALQQEPDRRYQQASEMKVDVDRIRTTPPQKAKPPGGRRFVAALITLAALLVVGGTAYLIYQRSKPDGALTKQRPPAAVPILATTTLPTPAPHAQPPGPEAIGEARKRLAEAQAHLKAGDLAEARKLAQAALTAAPGDLSTQAGAALILAEAQAPERAAALAQEFVAKAEAEHPQFAAISELRVKLAPTLKQYEQHLRTAAELMGKGDEEGELRELQAALALLPDGQQAVAKLAANPLHVGKPLPGRRFTNPLGHRFVPVDRLPNVLFSIWETRVKNFEQFVKETGHDMSAPRSEDGKATWQQPGFEQTGDHPVILVSREDANAFCRWLTQKARAAGTLLPGQVYRLPTDREWSAAMGVLNEPGDFPADREFPKDIVTWGKGTPPRNAENLSWKNDDFPNTAPVGSGQPNRFGLYDLLGNVGELCADPWAFDEPWFVVRGNSFKTNNLTQSRAGKNNVIPRHYGWSEVGFRCVLDLKTDDQRAVQIALEAAGEKLKAHESGWKQKSVELNTLVNDEMVLLDLDRWSFINDDVLQYFSGIPITHCYGRGASDKGLLAVQKMPLRTLSLRELFVTERFLEPLSNLPLEWLFLQQHLQGKMPIRSLAPLSRMKLKGLGLSGCNNLESLEPLRGLPLETFKMSGPTPSLDLTPLKDAPLRKVYLPESITFDRLLGAIDWWAGKVKVFDGDRRGIFTDLLLEAALTRDPERVKGLKTVLKSKLASAPSAKNFLAELDSNSFAKGEDFAIRLARWQGGDHRAFEGAYQTFDGHAYLPVEWTRSYDEASEIARKLGGHLLTVTTAAENDFVIQQITSGVFIKEVWLGLERTGKGRLDWKWVTGEPLDFHQWGPEWGTGFEVASMVRVDDRMLWRDGAKFDYRPFVIEWDTPTPQPPAAGR